MCQSLGAGSQTAAEVLRLDGRAGVTGGAGAGDHPGRVRDHPVVGIRLNNLAMILRALGLASQVDRLRERMQN
jgi:hypothetical protein